MKNTQIEMDDESMVIKDVDIAELIPNVIDGILVNIFEDHQTLYLSPTCNGLQFKNWKKSKGGVFSKDVLNYTLNKIHGKYILVKGRSESYIARIVEEDEEYNLTLCDNRINDKSIIIMRHLDNTLSLTSGFSNIEDDTHFEDYEIKLNTGVKRNDNNDNSYRGSISLFND